MSASLAKQFWQWFDQNHEIYMKLPSFNEEDVEYWMKQSGVKIRAFDKNLFVEFYFPKNENIPQIIITAGGNEAFFHRVEELVSNAPIIPGWEIIGFHPPRLIDYGIEERWGHTGIDPHNLWVAPYLQFNSNKFWIQVFEDYKGRKTEFEQAVRVVLWNLLGERSATLDIANVKASKYKRITSCDRSDLMRLQDLPSFLERHKFSSLFIDKNGVLRKMNLE